MHLNEPQVVVLVGQILMYQDEINQQNVRNAACIEINEGAKETCEVIWNRDRLGSVKQLVEREVEVRWLRYHRQDSLRQNGRWWAER